MESMTRSKPLLEGLRMSFPPNGVDANRETTLVEELWLGIARGKAPA